MTNKRLSHAVVTLLALALRVSAQSGSSEPLERLGLDIRGIESVKTVPAEIPAATKVEARPKGPTEITAREATFDNRTHLATFAIEVLVKDPEFGLSCDRLTVNLKTPPTESAAKPAAKPKVPGEQKSGIEKAVAEGHVIITQDKPNAAGRMERYTGEAERAVFDNASGTLKLYGSPRISKSVGGVISEQIISLEKSCVMTLERAGKIDVKGYFRSTLQDAGSLNQAPR